MKSTDRQLKERGYITSADIEEHAALGKAELLTNCG